MHDLLLDGRFAMNAKEARDIIRQKSNQTTKQVHETLFAEGYLTALEGPEVKALVEAIEVWEQSLYLAERENQPTVSYTAAKNGLLRALTAFKKATEKQ